MALPRTMWKAPKSGPAGLTRRRPHKLYRLVTVSPRLRLQTYQRTTPMPLTASKQQQALRQPQILSLNVNAMNEDESFELVLHPVTSIEKTRHGAKRVLEVIVADILALASTDDPA